MRLNYERLGDYIKVVNKRNKKLEVETLLGVSIRKVLMPSIANTIGTNMTTYKIIKRNQFAYGPVTSRNGDKISIAILDEYDEAIVSQAYTVFKIIDENALSPEYLMMWFRRPEFDRYARYKSHGSAREIFGWDEMLETELPIPSIETQQEIVNEYQTITKRIQLNEQLNQKLEETAQALYKHWFVDFEFPDENGEPYKSSGGAMVFNEELDGEIPEGWENAKLENLLTVKYGKDYKHLKAGEIPLYGSGGVMGYYNQALYDKPSILIPRKGSLDNVLLVDEPFWSVDTMFYTTINDLNYTNYLFQFLKGIDYYSLNVGSAVPSMTTKVLNDLTVLNPSIEALQTFETAVFKVRKVIKENLIQNKSLVNFSELLLSKLASVESGEEIIN